MGLFNFFKHIGNDTQKKLTLEDCIIKMFSSVGIVPNQEGNKFATVVEGKHCVFNVALTCMEGNSLLVYVPFPIPVDANVAFAANYEVKRIGKEAAGVLPEAQVYLSEKEDGYNIIVATVKEFEELSDNTSDEIRNIMIHSVDILDDKNFASLAAAIFGYKTYEDAKMNMQAESTGGNNVTIQLKDGYHELLDKTPNLSNSRYGGRLMAYAIHIINKNDCNEVAERATEALQNSFDSFVQVVYDIADEEERDLMRKLRFLAKAKNEDDTNEDDFERGKMEGLVICNGNPWELLYEDGNTDDADMSEEGRLYKRLCVSLYKDYPYEQRDLGEGMTLVNQVIGEYWKPRYLKDNETKCAYEFMSSSETLQYSPIT